MLKIKDNVDLKELEKFGFEYKETKKPTWDSLWGSKRENYYIEKAYIYDDGRTTIEINAERKGSDWKHCNEIREIYIYESDYDVGISNKAMETFYNLIQAGLVEKVEE